MWNFHCSNSRVRCKAWRPRRIFLFDADCCKIIAVLLTMLFFWIVTSCGLVSRCQRLEQTYSIFSREDGDSMFLRWPLLLLMSMEWDYVSELRPPTYSQFSSFRWYMKYEIQLHAFLTSALAGTGQLASCSRHPLDWGAQSVFVVTTQLWSFILSVLFPVFL
jgi:hypothetical protein